MTPLKNGCLLLERLRTDGIYPTALRLPGVGPFVQAAREVADTRIHAIWDATQRAKMGEPMHFAGMRPCFDNMWVETLSPSKYRIGFYVSNGPAKGLPKQMDDDTHLTTIVGFSLADDSQRHPRPMASVQFMLDKHGHGRAYSSSSILPGTKDDPGSLMDQVNAVYPAVRVLQAVNAINVGFFGVADADENNPRLPREARRAAAARRYHVLTLRSRTDIRLGRKLVDAQGSMPLNIARGYWRCYGPAAVHRHPDGQDRELLFGLYAGRYWIPAHERGDSRNGVIEKDYAIAEPQTPAVEFPPIVDNFRAATGPLNMDRPAAKPEATRNA